MESTNPTSETTGRMERIVHCTPAFDERHPDPKKNYGIGGVRISFVLKGDKGATQFVVLTNWYPPHVQEERLGGKSPLLDQIQPMGCDIGYHSPVPQYEGQKPMKGDCAYITSGPCYYDGSSLQAVEFVPQFLSGGSDAVWAMLLERYNELFHTKES